MLIDSAADYELTYRNGRAMLTIPEVFVEDAGTYVCVATNAAGSVRSSTELSVKRKIHLFPLKIRKCHVGKT